MAKSIDLPEAELQVIAAQVAPSLGLLFSRNENVEVELAEIFEVWYLDGRIEDPSVDITTRARFSGAYHHQMLLDDVPVGFVISRRGRQPSDWNVHRIAPSPFAQLVSDAIEAVDRLFPDDTHVRMLKLPAYRLAALWLVDPVPKQQKLYVISCPMFFVFLRKGQVLSADEFVKAVAEEQATGALKPRKARESAAPGPERLE